MTPLTETWTPSGCPACFTSSAAYMLGTCWASIGMRPCSATPISDLGLCQEHLDEYRQDTDTQL